MKNKFPSNFIFGSATSSYQIEGAIHQGGRGESIWDRFTSKAGAIADKSDGSHACNHYNLWPQDIDLMSDLNLEAYRFSIAWPRIQPTGSGDANKAGLDFYSRIVDYLLEKNIQPWVTLYHWDLPQVLQDNGGWINRDIVNRFNDYADIVSNHLGDRVKHWITHNEPWCISYLGYLNGEHAPGHKDWGECLAAAHHLLLSHGTATPIIRRNSKDSKVGITLNLCPGYPASHSSHDLDAEKVFDGEFNRWFLDPLYHGEYPQDIVARHQNLNRHGSDMDFVKEGDMANIKVATDFLGINYYSRGIIRSQEITEEENSPRIIPEPNPEEFTDMGWEVYSEGLYDLLQRLHREYQPGDIYITENGAAYHTAPDTNGVVNDRKRIDYFQDHLSACQRAVHAGIPLKGYFAWSLLDNFEWAYGYEKRFGLVWVDYETQQRIPKNSALWYRDFIAQKRETEL